jgi:hypothetical protein
MSLDESGFSVICTLMYLKMFRKKVKYLAQTYVRYVTVGTQHR